MGGKSSSSSSSSTTSNVYDNRAVVGDGGLAITGSGVNLSTSSYDTRTQINYDTDHGAVSGAIDLAKTTVAGQNKTLADTLSTFNGFLNRGLDFVTAQGTRFDSTLGEVTKRYDGILNAKLTADSASTQEMMKLGGLVLIGVIALGALKRGN